MPAVADSTAAPEPIWGFRPAPSDGGRDFGNANVWSFEPRVAVFVREVLQNALDAVARPGGRVDVTFRLVRLRGGDLARYQEHLRWDSLREHLEASTRNEQKLCALLADGLRHLEDTGELLLMIVEDAGTIGLLGPEKGRGSKFAALCRDNLNSEKGGAGLKGGAFGLGKGVLWRASRFSTVLFGSNLLRPPEGRDGSDLRLIGRCDLTWHERDGRSFAGPGWFGTPGPASDAGGGEQDPVSVWDRSELAAELYLDRGAGSDGPVPGPGTSACVVGFHDPGSDEATPSPKALADQVAGAAAEHFFPAITRERLSVTVETFEGRDAYRARRPAYRTDVNVKELRPQFVDALVAHLEGDARPAKEAPDAAAGDVVAKAVPLEVLKRKDGAAIAHGDRAHEHEAILLVRFAGEEEGGDTLNRVALFRGPGMVVEERAMGGVCLGARPFHALLLCGLAAGDGPAAEAAEEFLRTAEPPSHNRWEPTADLKSHYAHGCLSRLREFHAAWRDALRELVKPGGKDLGDGPQALRDLFRIGTEPAGSPREKPRILPPVQGEVDAQGRWEIRGKIRLKAADRPTRVVPAVLFLAESGGGTPVRWESLEGDAGCVADGHCLVIPANTRQATFTGRTDPASHPVPARESCIQVEIRDSWLESAGERAVEFDAGD